MLGWSARVLCAVAAFGGCANSTGPASRPSVSTKPTPPQLPAADPWDLTYVDFGKASSLWENGEIITMGRWRVRATKDSVTISEQGTESAIAYARLAGEGEVVVTRNGVAYRAAKRLGPLTYAGDTRGAKPSTIFTLAAGVEVLHDERGALWRLAPSSPALARTLGEGQVADLAVVGTTLFVIRGAGSLARSSDGAQTFVDVELRGACARRFHEQAGGGVIFESTRGMKLVTAAGKVTEVAEGEAAAGGSAWPFSLTALNEVGGRVQQRLEALYAPATLPAGALPEGGRSLFLHPLEEVKNGVRKRIELPAVTGSCSARLGARHAFLTCTLEPANDGGEDAGEGLDALYRLDAAGWTHLGSVATLDPEARPSAAVSAAGGIVVRSACRSEDAESVLDPSVRAHELCWYDGTRFRNRRLVTGNDEDDLELVDLNRTTLLYRTPTKPTGFEYAVVDLARDSKGRRLETSLGEGAVADAHLVDGTVFAEVVRGRARYLASGILGRKLEVKPLPAGALHVAMANAQRGVATGRNLAQLWGTVDGGASWRPLLFNVRGDARSIELEGRPRCAAHSCQITEDWMWAPRSALQAAGQSRAELVAPPSTAAWVQRAAPVELSPCGK